MIDKAVRMQVIAELRQGGNPSEVAKRWNLLPQTVHTWNNRYVLEGQPDEAPKPPPLKLTAVDVEVPADLVDAENIGEIIKNLINGRIFIAANMMADYNRLSAYCDYLRRRAAWQEGESKAESLAMEAECRAGMINAGVKVNAVLESVGVPGLPADAVDDTEPSPVAEILAAADKMRGEI